MESQLARVLDALLRLDEVPEHETQVFRVLEHNQHLCPTVERQANRVLDNFNKYRAVAYDVQGIHDRGTDVMLRYYPDGSEGEWRAICFQLKSRDDLNRDGYLRELRAQYFDATRDFGSKLEHYYILLGGDLASDRDKVRNVKSIFRDVEGSTVVDPGFFLSFLHVNSKEIGLVAESYLRGDDVVLQRAKAVVSDLTPPQTAIILTLLERKIADPTCEIESHEVLETSFVKKIYEATPDLPVEVLRDPDRYVWEQESRYRIPRERFVEDVAKLENRFIYSSSYGDTIELDWEAIRPLQVQALDATLRYEYWGEELFEYLFGQLQVMDRANLAFDLSRPERDGIRNLALR